MNRSPKRKQGHRPTPRLTPEAKAAVQHVKPLVKPKRRLRSGYVILGSVGTLIMGLCVYGIVREEDRTCVDANNAVIDNRECEENSTGARWYYGGSNSGGRMSGGSFERGGFGGHGGGGS